MCHHRWQSPWLDRGCRQARGWMATHPHRPGRPRGSQIPFLQGTGQKWDQRTQARKSALGNAGPGAPTFLLQAPEPSRCPRSHSRSGQPRHRGRLRVGACVGAVLFGGKQRPFWRDQGLSAQLEVFLELGVGRGGRSPGHSRPAATSAPHLPVATRPEPSASREGPHVCTAQTLGWSAQQDRSFSRADSVRHGAPSGVRGTGALGARPGLALLLSPPSPAAPLVLSGSGGSRDGLGLTGGRWGRSRASRGGGRGTSVWAGVLGVGPRPRGGGSREGPRLAPARRWLVTEDPGGGGQVGTWQHSQGQAGLGGLRAGSTHG